MRMRFSNKDACGYDPEHTDPLYKHVPFFLKMNPSGDSMCGVYYNTAADCELDIGREVNGYYPPMGQFLTAVETHAHDERVDHGHGRREAVHKAGHVGAGAQAYIRQFLHG